MILVLLDGFRQRRREDNTRLPKCFLPNSQIIILLAIASALLVYRSRLDIRRYPPQRNMTFDLPLMINDLKGTTCSATWTLSKLVGIAGIDVMSTWLMDTVVILAVDMMSKETGVPFHPISGFAS